MTGHEYRAKLGQIKGKMLRGELTYDEAKKEAQPIIDEMNKLGREIAAKYGKRHTNFTFGYLMR